MNDKVNELIMSAKLLYASVERRGEDNRSCLMVVSRSESDRQIYLRFDETTLHAYDASYGENRISIPLFALDASIDGLKAIVNQLDTVAATKKAEFDRLEAKRLKARTQAVNKVNRDLQALATEFSVDVDKLQKIYIDLCR